MIARVPQCEKADVDAAVAAARKAFDQGPWPRMSPSQRGRILWKIGDLILENLEELAQLEAIDNGKPITVARAADVPLAADLFHYMAGWATKIEGHTISLSVPVHTGSGVSRVYTPRAHWCRRTDHSLEFPVADGSLETGPGAQHGLHGCVEAGGGDATLGAAPRGARARKRACRMAC